MLEPLIDVALDGASPQLQRSTAATTMFVYPLRNEQNRCRGAPRLLSGRYRRGAVGADGRVETLAD